MVAALLALQQEAGVLQVTGQAVAPPLQLVSHRPGPLVSSLQLRELWEQQDGSPSLLALTGFSLPIQAAAISGVSRREKEGTLGVQRPCLDHV